MGKLRRKSCVVWTIEKLKGKGLSFPPSFKGIPINDNDNIIAKEKELIQNKIWQPYFESFLTRTEKPSNWDIISHNEGSGIFIDGLMWTITKLNKEVLREIPRESIFFRRAI